MVHTLLQNIVVSEWFRLMTGIVLCTQELILIDLLSSCVMALLARECCLLGASRQT